MTDSAGESALTAPDGSRIHYAVGRSTLLPDPRLLLDILRRRVGIFLLVAAVIMATAVAYAKLAPRWYEASARILIEPRKGDVVTQPGTDDERTRGSDFIDTQILIADSPQLARATAQALGLDNVPAFAGTSPSADERLEAAGQAVRDLTAIRRVGATSLIEVVATTRSPQLSARLANELVAQYLKQIAVGEAQKDQLTNQQIDSKLDQLRTDAEKADAALLQYKIANGLMSAQGATMAEQETSTLNQQIAQARATLAEREGRLAAARRQLEQGGGGGDVTSALNSGTIGALRAQEAESSRNLAQLNVRYGPKHPAVAQESQRLADIRHQIQLEIDRILTSLQGEVNVAQSGLASLLASQGQSKAKLAGNETAQAGYLELERKANAARTVYEAFLNRSRGAAARDGIQPPIATLSSAALEPTDPSAPNARLAYLFGLLFGITGGIIAIAVAEFLDTGVKSRSDVEHRLGATYLGAIPDIRTNLKAQDDPLESPEAYIVARPLSAFAESVRSLRTAVTLGRRTKPRVLAVTSALPEEGKSTTTLCLARSLAMSGASTLLIDCDVRRHSASERLLVDREGRLLDVLAGALPLEAAIHKDYETELRILGLTIDLGNQVDPLTPEALSQLLAVARTKFEFVMIDTAPLLGIADARTVAQLADAVVLLARWRKTPIRAVDAALDLLVSVEANVAGVALTQVDVNKFGSSREELYGYQKQFKGYYTN